MTTTAIPARVRDRDAWTNGFAHRLNVALAADKPGVNARIEELCAVTGIDRTRVYAWRTGKALPNAHAVALLVAYYQDIPTDVMLGVI